MVMIDFSLKLLMSKRDMQHPKCIFSLMMAQCGTSQLHIQDHPIQGFWSILLES